MHTRIFLSLLFCTALFVIGTHGQSNVADRAKTAVSPHLRISIIMAGPGTHTFEALGHICIRVIDSTREGDWHDVVFNYGTFDYYEDGFVRKIVSGDLRYYLSIIKYSFFIDTVVAPERSITEQVLLLNEAEKLSLIMLLQKNALPENKYYKYNFFADDCSTRIYNIIRDALRSGFVFGKTLTENRVTTYFDLCLPYYRCRHWERVGACILFENRMGMAAGNVEATFLPAYLSKGIETATMNGRQLCRNTVILREDTIVREQGINQPLILTSLIAFVTVLSYSVKRLFRFRRIIETVVLLITGTIGILILYAWLGTRHAGTEKNLNLLWAVPANIIVPLLKPGVRKWYACVALCSIFISAIFYALHIFILPIAELLPLFLALVVIFVSMCRGSQSWQL